MSKGTNRSSFRLEDHHLEKLMILGDRRGLDKTNMLRTLINDAWEKDQRALEKSFGRKGRSVLTSS